MALVCLSELRSFGLGLRMPHDFRSAASSYILYFDLITKILQDPVKMSSGGNNLDTHCCLHNDYSPLF